MRSRRVLLAVVAAVLLALGATATASAGGSALPATLQWSSSGPLIAPQPDATHPVVSVKDPSVVRYKGKWYVFATTADTSGGWSLVQMSFTDWSQAGSAHQTPLDTTAIGKGYRAAPQIFYFAPEKTWYLVYQTGVPSYSTTKNIDDPTSWSAPKNFQDAMPQIIKDNIGNGYWVDFWTVCDEEKCYLFSSDDNGHLYRSETTVKQFPEGFGNTKIVLQDSKFSLFEASNVYKLKGSDRYLLLNEAIGSDGRRYFRSWTSEGLDGSWTAYADTEDNPFARSTNVTFADGTAWTKDISHGELVRDGIDQTMQLDPCRIRFLYQGLDPAASGDYSQLPYRLGLLTQTNAAC
ncbi:non-reducing end alpha-L-arabinofuranosidase family hydrolase [Streptomyces sp. VRA16 Mangrove soil]|uniref:non-reducing end alpha-L-arabinofuranosidase family hydrolase n=1 Tax=Streptomyces sp. VRA16 Mangrove soil TaxID=2817434 RepID=UPI0027DDA017|nr:non-reducing end alpha-L-arabinofuranosidase family hydrolase [Streptomyces sp. VRA16 Mangrove soil]